jgi:starch phosphorylase
MKNFQTFQVFPNIPENLQFLEILSRNMWWCWNKDGIELFRRMEPALWVESGRNPIAAATPLLSYRKYHKAALKNWQRIKAIGLT